MSTTKTPEQLGEVIRKFLMQDQSAIFCGAGIGCRVDLPTWRNFVATLADACDEFEDPASATLIRQNIEDERYLEAGAIFEMSSKIPVGEKARKLRELFDIEFGDEQLEKLKPLISLPFKGIVTTNYDNSLNRAAAKFTTDYFNQVDLPRTTSKGMTLHSGRIIARIHGQAEQPETLVYSVQHYEKISQNDSYCDFLSSFFRSRPTLFLGFSFLDPAVNKVLETVEKALSPNFPHCHLALLPSNSSPALQEKLSDLNIRCIYYDNTEFHRDLWRGIRIAYENEYPIQDEFNFAPVTISDLAPPDSHRVLAFTYAKLKTSEKERRPALELTVDGIILSVLDDEPTSYLERTTIVEKTRLILGIELESAKKVVQSSIDRLRGEGEIDVLSSMIRRRSSPSSELNTEISKLREGVVSRIKVFSKQNADNVDPEKIDSILEKVIIRRAWDIAPLYAGSLASGSPSVEKIIQKVIKDEFSNEIQILTELTESIANLFQRPTSAESQTIGDLSRTAFVLQLVVASTRELLCSNFELPTRVFLDASVLLPGIVKGHPYYEGYNNVIGRLVAANNENGQSCKLLFGSQFLGEIVGNRKLSIQLYEELQLGKSDNLLNYISYYGAENANVFLSAFAHYIHNTRNPNKKKSTFYEFLNRFAPYKTKDELKGFLVKTRGIDVESMNFEHQNNVDFNHIYNELSAEYENSRKQKEPHLIKHEAQQLTKLFLEVRDGNNSVFVTADRGLQRIIRKSRELVNLGSNIMTEFAFTGLVDLVAGLSPDNELLTRLAWGNPRSESQKQVRDYLVHRAMLEYDQALLMQMSDVADKVIERHNSEIRSMRDSLRNSSNLNSVKANQEFLDRVENSYFQEMAKEVDKQA